MLRASLPFGAGRTQHSCRGGADETMKPTQGSRVWLGQAQAVAQSHGDSVGLQFKPWNPKVWSMEKPRLTVPDSQESSSGWARRPCQTGFAAA